MMKKDINASLAEEEEDDDHLLLSSSSPDLGLLKLPASPELERLIIQTSLHTSSSSSFLYPKTGVSDEQEFAAGFVKALEDLHKQNQLGGVAGGAGACVHPATVQPDLPVYTNLSSYGGAPLGTHVSYSTADAVAFPPPPPGETPPSLPGLSRVLRRAQKDEPQTVPDVQSFGGDGSPPPSPVHTDPQERLKAERKRLRNRIAASKCRKRKLERISRLEDKVKTLKSHNSDLASTAGLLREQVEQLKRKVLSHVTSGCQLLPHQVRVH